MFKVNPRTRCEICLKLTIKKPERRQWHRFRVFIVNFEYISHRVSIVNFDQVNTILQVYRRILPKAVKKINSKDSVDKEIYVKDRELFFVKTLPADSPCMKCANLRWINNFHSWILPEWC